jgi:hypothetical protein
LSERDDEKKEDGQSVVARESLSALMDDEANDLDLARSLRGVGESEALRTLLGSPAVLSQFNVGQYSAARFD